jgi:hypothetical protein
MDAGGDGAGDGDGVGAGAGAGVGHGRTPLGDLAAVASNLTPGEPPSAPPPPPPAKTALRKTFEDVGYVLVDMELADGVVQAMMEEIDGQPHSKRFSHPLFLGARKHLKKYESTYKDDLVFGDPKDANVFDSKRVGWSPGDADTLHPGWLKKVKDVVYEAGVLLKGDQLAVADEKDDGGGERGRCVRRQHMHISRHGTCK